MTTPRPGTTPTDRERVVLRAWVAADFGSAGAAAMLHCTDSAVRQHVRAVMIRTGIQTRRGLERWLRKAAHESAPTQLVTGL